MHERFNGKGSFKVIKVNHHKIDDPLKWKKPCKIFVNSMSDLFHEDVPFSFIATVFEVIKKAHWHTFQVLTKRPERMVKFFEEYQFYFKNQIPNLWLGVSAENQETLDERVPYLLKINVAKVRFISCEPLLGRIKLKPEYKGNIHWIIAGGESGHQARIMEYDWINLLIDQCYEYKIPIFFKQWGEYLTYSMHLTQEQRDLFLSYKNKPNYLNFKPYCRVGKKNAGNTIYGRQYLDFPQTD